MSDFSFKRLFKFNPNRLGYLAEYIEPVSSGLEEEYIKSLFSQHPNLLAVPVESDGGVSGLVLRDFWLHAEHRKLTFKQKTAGDLVLENVLILDSMESITSAVQKLMDARANGPFLVYHAGRYLGVSGVREVLMHSALLRAEDLEQAKRVQDNFMYISKEIHPALNFCWFNKMAHEVGGDFIQWRRLNSDLWLLGLFDLAGKGVSAALSTSLITAYFATLELTGSLEHERPGRIIYMLHKLMQQTLIDDSFVACAFAFFDLKESALHLYNCGLGPVFINLSAANGRNKLLKVDPNLPPLGFEGFPEDKLTQSKVKWVPGLKIFASTDGFSDMKNGDGRQFGDELLETFMNEQVNKSASDLHDVCVQTIKSWIGNAPQADDVTFAVVEWPLPAASSGA
jgi:sigma-B regulation protein RsbU (phosphoserine phosphatase)